jgi:uncharacterized membrane protein
LWLKVRYSFWFLPTVFVLGAVALAAALIAVDGWFESRTLERWPRLFGAGAEGSRGLLTAVASSMITVAGVVFSITLVALSLASSQYTSRVVRNFMSDRGNQAVLGAFVGIFAYCLVVLRTIRGGEQPFVPSLAVLVGLLLGLVGIAVLIYFIHHISISIQASHILAAAAGETLRTVDRLFPAGESEEDTIGKREALDGGKPWYPVAAIETGYLQNLDKAGLLDFASEHRTALRMEREIGEFVIEGVPLVSVLGAAPTDDERRRLGKLYVVGHQRTVEQDPGFGICQIVDVALKALSPGVNDTTTAVMCIDHLTSILVRLTDRRIESDYRSEDGELRLLTCGPTYAGMVGQAFDPIRQNAAGNVAVLEGLLRSLDLLADRTTSLPRRRVLLAHAQAVAELSRRSVSASRDIERVRARAAGTIELLAGKADAAHGAASDDADYHTNSPPPPDGPCHSVGADFS